jgi:hypothetical protein
MMEMKEEETEEMKEEETEEMKEEEEEEEEMKEGIGGREEGDEGGERRRRRWRNTVFAHVLFAHLLRESTGSLRWGARQGPEKLASFPPTPHPQH